MFSVEKSQKYFKWFSFSIPKIYFDFSTLFGCLMLGIQGEFHDAHPYFLKFYYIITIFSIINFFKIRAGINSITLKGIKKNKQFPANSNQYSLFSRFFK